MRSRLAVATVERCSGIAYLRAVFACQEQGHVTIAAAAEVQAIPGTRIIEHIACPPGGGWFDGSIAPRDNTDPALIALSSGTTGESKAVLLSHRALADVTQRLVAATQLDGGVREYVGVPVTHSFGFARIRAVAAVGGASFLPSSGFRVEEFATMLERGEINALSAVPTLIRLVLDQRARFERCGHLLRWIEIGSQPMHRREKEVLRTLFPNARIILHYGLTEASRSTFLDISTAQGALLDSVGHATGAVELRITDGLIAIRGPHLATCLITARGIEPLTDAAGWLVTGDRGELRDGALHYLGRADHLINVAGIKLSPESFEAQLTEQLGCAEGIAVVRGADLLRGERILVAHEPSAIDPAALHAAASRVAHALGAGDAVALVAVDAIPRTETGKVRRAELERKLDVDPSAPAQAPLVAAAAVPAIAQIYRHEFGARARDDAVSFESLGGDSLQYVTIMLRLETCLPDLPEDWETLSIAELNALANPLVAAVTESAGEAREGNDDPLTGPVVPPAVAASLGAQRRSALRNLDSVRGLACLLVVAVHVTGLDLSNGLRLPTSSAWHSVMTALDLIRMPLFTALAGIMYGVYPASREGYGSFIRRRARQLLIPFAFATPVFVVLVGLVYGFDTNLFAAYAYGYSHLWYLSSLFTILAVVGLIETRFNPPAWLYAATAAMIVASYWAIPNIELLRVRDTLFLAPFFILGLMLHRRPSILRSRLLLALAAPTLVAVIIVQDLGGGPLDVWSFTPSLLLFVAGAASIIIVLRTLPRLAWLAWMAPYSLAIYLWHTAANAAVRNGLWALGATNVWMLFCIGLAVGVLIPVAMQKIALRLPRFVSLPLIGR